MIDKFPLLFGGRWPATGLSEAVSSIDLRTLAKEYRSLHAHAPRRSLRDKKYFLGHAGVTSSGTFSNRREEHFAVALANLRRRWSWPSSGWFQFLDYQVPLKARRDDSSIGKIDLLGVSGSGQLVVAELKVDSASGGRGDSPVVALMEGLRYSAIVEADQAAIAGEASSRFQVRVSAERPAVLILGSEAWWQSWLLLPAAGPWAPPFEKLITDLSSELGIRIECLAISDPGLTLGLEGKPPSFRGMPTLSKIPLSASSAVAATAAAATAIGVRAAAAPDPPMYLREVHVRLWAWAERHHVDKLDGGGKEGRSPVLQAHHASFNVLVPPDASDQDSAEIRAAISPDQRHKHFASLRSSQALAQSVFAGVRACGRLDILAGLHAECGRSAFFERSEGWTLTFERQVRWLREPRPTSVDVFLAGAGRVAVECKFTEQEFGTCSRPRLRPSDPTFATQWCDGHYRPQHGRAERCALTTLGVAYWEFLPALFHWSADHDHSPCPFGFSYQLARNALAAALRDDGVLDPTGGHALVLYDARNPAFRPGGLADQQWHAALDACKIPGLLRRLSWQSLSACFKAAPELAWLVRALADKYGLEPDPIESSVGDPTSAQALDSPRRHSQHAFSAELAALPKLSFVLIPKHDATTWLLLSRKGDSYRLRHPTRGDWSTGYTLPGAPTLTRLFAQFEVSEIRRPSADDRRQPVQGNPGYWRVRLSRVSEADALLLFVGARSRP